MPRSITRSITGSITRSVINKMLIGLSLLLVTGSVGYGVYRKTTNSARPKPNILQSIFTSKGVTNRIIRIELKYDQVKTHGEEVEIKAYVTMPFSYSAILNYKWKLGEGVSIADGALTGQIGQLVKAEPQLITLRVKGFGQESNHQIGFEVIGERAEQTLYGDAMIASDLEDTFENTVQNVERLKANQ